MRAVVFAGIAVLTLGGCSTGGIQHFSTYDIDRDGVMEARCPGMEYELDSNRWYSWRNKASKQCAEDQPLPEDEINAHIPPEMMDDEQDS